jgi:hypothetical protein
MSLVANNVRLFIQGTRIIIVYGLRHFKNLTLCVLILFNSEHLGITTEMLPPQQFIYLTV